MKVVSVAQMQEIERSANEGGMSYEQMMHHAGESVANWIVQHFSEDSSVVGLIGSGNNGGDTIIALIKLSKLGFRTIAFLVKERQDDPLIDEYIHSGGSVVDLSQDTNYEYLKASLMPGVLVLDGILGTGLHLPIKGLLFEIMSRIKDEISSMPELVIIAVDCPSGIDCDTGEASEATLRANVTLCMAAAKQGLLKPPGRLKAGELYTVDIGISDLSAHISDPLPDAIDERYAKQIFPHRSNLGHKGTFGTCMVIAGSSAYTGAAFLAGKAAYLSGCGLVRVATTEKVHTALAGELIEAVWTIMHEKDLGYDPGDVALLLEDLHRAHSIVVGPGMGLSETNQKFLDSLLDVLPVNLPTVFDADGLKLLSRLDHWWDRLPKNTILTPHPGEMAILSGLEIHEIQSNRWAVTQKFADEWRAAVLLKGAVSVIGLPGGGIILNPICDSALATAGSGDVLAGVIGGLLAQGLSVKNAVAIGTWVHSRTGELIRKQQIPEMSVTALDILYTIGFSFNKLKETPRTDVSN